MPLAGTRSRKKPNKNASPGPGRCTYEIIKVCLDDWETLQLLTSVAEDFARGTSPEVSKAFFFATFTAQRECM